MRIGQSLALIELLKTYLEQNSFAEKSIDNFVKKNPNFGSKDRRILRDYFFKILRHKYRFDYLLTTQKMPVDAVHIYLAAALSFDLPIPKEFQEIADKIKLDETGMPPEILAECPADLWPEFLSAYGDQALPLLQSLQEQAPLDIRFHLHRLTKEKAAAELGAEPCGYSPYHVRLLEKKSLRAHPLYEKGWIDIQDQGSGLAALMLDPQAGEKILDFCAGAGGKSLFYATLLKDKCAITAMDIDGSRLDELKKRAQRAQLKSIQILEMSGEKDAAKSLARESFHAVVVDAPCSGSGTWRRQPDLRWRMSAAKQAELLLTQARILQEAASFVKHGGRLLYITCSLLPAENERQIEAFLKLHPNFVVEPLAPVFEALTKTSCPFAGDFLKLSPLTSGTDGFFAARLKRIN